MWFHLRTTPNAWTASKDRATVMPSPRLLKKAGAKGDSLRESSHERALCAGISPWRRKATNWVTRLGRALLVARGERAGHADASARRGGASWGDAAMTAQPGRVGATQPRARRQAHAGGSAHRGERHSSGGAPSFGLLGYRLALGSFRASGPLVVTTADAAGRQRTSDLRSLLAPRRAGPVHQRRGMPSAAAAAACPWELESSVMF